MKRLTLIALVLTIITSLWARAALAIEACELNVEYGDDDDPCVVINDSSVIQKKYQENFKEGSNQCTLKKITDAIKADNHYCKFDDSADFDKDARVILFQTAKQPTHDTWIPNFTESTVTKIDKDISIDTSNSAFLVLSGALSLWDNDDKNKDDYCFGDYNNDGECKEDSNDATDGGVCASSCYSYAPTYCQYEKAKGHLGCSSNFNCMQDCQDNYIESCVAKCPAKPNDYSWNDQFVQGKVKGVIGKTDPNYPYFVVNGPAFNWNHTIETSQDDECNSTGEYLTACIEPAFDELVLKTYFDVTIIEPHKITSTDYFPEFAESASKYYRAKIQLDKDLTLTGTGTVVLRDIELIGNGGQLIIDGPQVFFERSIFRNIHTEKKLDQLIHVKSGTIAFGNQWETEGFGGPNLYVFNNADATPPKAYIRCEKDDCLGSYGGNGGGTIVQTIDSLIEFQRFEWQQETAVIIFEPQKSLKCTYYTEDTCMVKNPPENLMVATPDDDNHAILAPVLQPYISTTVYDTDTHKTYKLVPVEPSCNENEVVVKNGEFFECQKIPTGAKYDKDNNSFVCPENYTLNASQDACATNDTCPDGQKINFGETCEDHCGEGKEWNTKFHKCVEPCPTGAHYDLLETTDNYYTDGCVCDNTELVLKDGSCQACPANMYRIGNSCLCPSNYWQTDDGSVCKPKVACDPTSTKSVNNTCACIYTGATLDAGGTSCSCPAGTTPKKDFTTGFKETCVTTEIVKEQPPVGSGTGPVEKAVGGLNDGCAETSDCAEGMACENSTCVCDTANGYCYDSDVTFQCLKTDACNGDDSGGGDGDIDEGGNEPAGSQDPKPATVPQPKAFGNSGCMSVSGTTLPQGIAGFLPYLLVLLTTRIRKKS